MIDRVAIIIAPNWHDYAEKYLANCVESLRKQKFSGSFKIFMADNESTPESVASIKKIAPEIELTINKTNDGFAKGNNDALKMALSAGYEYFILLNMDTEVDENWLSELVKTADKLDNWGAVQSRVMLFDKPAEINTLGNSLHYLGLGFSFGGGRKWLDYKTSEATPITYFSGVSVLLKKEIFDKVGLFDEEFWMYHDDLELSWKIRLAGYQIYLAPESVVYHKYQFAKSIKQYYWMERNRFICLLTNYKLLTLLLILPMLILLEVGLLLFSFKNGFWREKFRVYGWLLNFKNWSYLARRRKELKKIRKIKDKDLVKYLASKIEFQEVDNVLLRWIGNPIMVAYWWVTRRLIFW